MYCGTRDELETQGASGVFYSIWLECEDFGGEGFHPDAIETEIEGGAYDTWQEAYDVIFGEFRDSGILEDFLDQNPDIAWVGVTIEKNEFEDGVDRGYEIPLYALMLDRSSGELVCCTCDEQGNVERLF